MTVSAADFFVLLVGGILGALCAWLVLKGRIAVAETRGHAAGDIERTQLAAQLQGAGQEAADLRSRLAAAEARVASLLTDLDTANRQCAQLTERTSRITELETTVRELEAARDALLGRQFEDRSRIAELNTLLEQERAQAQEKLALLNDAREQLTNQFKALANEILDEKSRKFTEQNQTNLDQLLAPLKERLTTFQAKVEEVYINEGKDRSALAEQVRMLTTLNTTLSQETQNLTLALKGDPKAQGNLGEIILDDILAKAGLIKGQHYDRQEAVKTENGQSHVIPDVVVHMPGEKHLVIDSKMTVPDYRVFATATNDVERYAALKRHLTSIHAHVKGLSEKNYQSLYGLKSLDFVVMFVPLEPAFIAAVTNDQDLFQYAWERNVLLVSPSTLLFVVRTVAYLWRQEDIGRNAKDISNRGAELYDKLVGFVADLTKIGERLDQAQESYLEARKKLSDGHGNVIRQAEMLKKLGVKPSKALPAALVEGSVEEAVPQLEAPAPGPLEV